VTVHGLLELVENLGGLSTPTAHGHCRAAELFEIITLEDTDEDQVGPELGHGPGCDVRIVNPAPPREAEIRNLDADAGLLESGLEDLGP
jgi:hypothetical protein